MKLATRFRVGHVTRSREDVIPIIGKITYVTLHLRGNLEKNKKGIEHRAHEVDELNIRMDSLRFFKLKFERRRLFFPHIHTHTLLLFNIERKFRGIIKYQTRMIQAWVHGDFRPKTC